MCWITVSACHQSGNIFLLVSSSRCAFWHRPVAIKKYFPICLISAQMRLYNIGNLLTQVFELPGCSRFIICVFFCFRGSGGGQLLLENRSVPKRTRKEFEVAQTQLEIGIPINYNIFVHQFIISNEAFSPYLEHSPAGACICSNRPRRRFGRRNFFTQSRERRDV